MGGARRSRRRVPGRKSLLGGLLKHARCCGLKAGQPIGNVTIPANHKVPAVGAVVETRYLYAYPDGSLYQPVYLGERSDVRQNECVVSQMKFKRDEDEAV
ncbi:MAG: hypothetical protein RL077_2749 [Verrucomicrobiota bacterium]|jgi:hypothetical protein